MSKSLVGLQQQRLLFDGTPFWQQGGGYWRTRCGSTEDHAGRRHVTADELTCPTKVAAHQLHVPSVSGAVQLDCTARIPGRVSTEVSPMQASDHRGFDFAEYLQHDTVGIWFRHTVYEEIKTSQILLSKLCFIIQNSVMILSIFHHNSVNRPKADCCRCSPKQWMMHTISNKT